MSGVRSRVQQLAEPLSEDLGYEVVDVQYQKEGRDWVLRILIDKPGGITLDDCQEFSRALEDELDHTGAIDRSYLLEVASPGLDRPLVKREDYLRFAGEEVKVRTYGPIDGRRNFRGTLRGLREDDVELFDGELRRIPLDQIAKANLVPDL